MAIIGADGSRQVAVATTAVPCSFLFLRLVAFLIYIYIY